MTSYPPQPPVRKLTRSRSNKMVGGVCAGLANYLNMDVTLVRILTVALSIFTGIGIVAYIVMLVVVPEEEPPPYVGPETVHVPPSATEPPATPADPVWGGNGAPWEQPTTGPSGVTDPAPTPEPGPAPADPAAPAEAGTPADPEPLPESATPESSPGEDSDWESTPAEPEQNDKNDKPSA